jgi:hypothetical protein
VGEWGGALAEGYHRVVGVERQVLAVAVDQRWAGLDDGHMNLSPEGTPTGEAGGGGVQKIMAPTGSADGGGVQKIMAPTGSTDGGGVREIT